MSTQESGFQLKELWEIIVKRKWVVATFFGVLVLVVLLGTLREQRIYKATATVAILPDTPKVVSFQEVQDLGASNYFLYQDYYNTQNKILKSYTIAGLVIDRLDLTMLDKEGKSVVMDPGTFVENLDIEPVKESQLVKVSYLDPDPELATQVANTVAQVYIEENLNQRVEVTKQAVDFLSQRLTELKDQIVRSESEVLKFKSANDIVGWDEKHNLVLQKLIDLNAAFSKSHTERIELEARAKKLRGLLAAGADRESVMPVLESHLIQQLKERLVELERERSEMASRYKSEHPKMRRLNEQITFVTQRIDGEVHKVLAAVQNEYLLKLAEELSLGRELENAKRQALALNQKLISHSALQQETDKNQELYDVLLQRLKETDITSNLRSNNLRIVDAAMPPEIPVKPNVPVSLALALLLGLVGGIGLAFFFEYLDNTIKTQDDVDRYLRWPLLGVVPAIEPGSEGVNRDLYAHNYPKSTLAESLRSVRTSIDFVAATQALPSLMVTSATPLEGKSTTSCNLGIALAQSGKRVVLIDTDLRRSRLHKAFGVPNERGFSSLLLGADDIANIAVATGVPNLWVIPSGPLPPNPSELLGSSRMDEIIALLQTRFDRVVFDTPPVMPVTDAIVLGRKVSGTVFVIKAGKVARDVAAEARRRLADINLNVLGVVLNAVDTSAGGYGYQYTYYYGNEDDGAASSRDDAKEAA